LIWSEDKRDRYMLDFYGGDVRGNEVPWGAYGNSPFGDPYFTELQLPHIEAMEQRIRTEIPGGEAILIRIQSTWLCAPKVFRYLEKLIAEIGVIDTELKKIDVTPFLQCEDTYPDFKYTGKEYHRLKSMLRQWLDGDDDRLQDLQNTSPVQRWLLHILWHKLVFHGTYEEVFRRMINEHPHGRSGTLHNIDVSKP
jgi:hypothetical protein